MTMLSHLSEAEIERRLRQCNDPIDTAPEVRQAFSDRLLKLVSMPAFPATNWYNDEDFARAYTAACKWRDAFYAEERRGLDDRNKLAKLPRTEDDVRIVPGMLLWGAVTYCNPIEVTGFTVRSDGSLSCLYFKGGFDAACPRYYSTKEALDAAEAARATS